MWYSSIKPFLAPEEAACDPMNFTRRLSCIVGNVGKRMRGIKKDNISVLILIIFLFKLSTMSYNSVTGVQWTNGLLFKNLIPTSPTMHLLQWVTSLEAVYPIVCSFLRRQKRLIHYYYLSYSTFVVELWLTTHTPILWPPHWPPQPQPTTDWLRREFSGRGLVNYVNPRNW